MTEQLDTYLRDQMRAAAQHAPAPPLELATTARRHARRQETILTVTVAAVALVVAAIGIAVMTGGGHPSTLVPVDPPIVRPIATPSASANAESELVETMDAYVEHDPAYTAELAAVPWGGRVFCDTVAVSFSRSGAKVYAWADCAQVYVKDGVPTIGSAGGDAIVLTVRHHVDGSGSYVIDRISKLEWPRQQTLRADYERLFPPAVRKRLPTGGYAHAPGDKYILARAQTELDAGRLGPGTPDAIAAAFLDFAHGTRDTIPADAPIAVYLANKLVKTIPSADVNDRGAWQICASPSAQRDCPVSPLTVLSNPDFMPTITTTLPSCLGRLADPPTETGGTQMRALVPYDATNCTQQYAVQIWTNDVGQITAVNLLLGNP
jgi:hypothetical protein